VPSPIDLQVLADNRDALLLAEVAAWLHDWEKCTDEHVQNHAKDSATKGPLPDLALYIPSLSVSLLGEALSLCSLLNRKGKSWLVSALSRCHRAAHLEKEEPPDKNVLKEFNEVGQQSIADTRLSSPFGYEPIVLSDLTARLLRLPFTDLSDRTRFQPDIQRVFTVALGDTRRPINEVTLWDWSSTVAALYKTALVGALLGSQPQPDDLHWRLLSIRVDGQAFYGHVARLPDLLARQQLLSNAFERVRVLLEEIYPLGTRVYQDQDSGLYVVPNVPGLLGVTDAQGVDLLRLIQAGFAAGTAKSQARLVLAGEIIPEISLDTSEWQAQRPDRTFDLPPIAEILKQPNFARADAQVILSRWTDDPHRDICPVCGLRPQGPGEKALERKVCSMCEERRADRAQEWADHLHTTIWTDEVADVNGRLALVVGQFDLEKWMGGTLVETLLVTDPALGNPIHKNPSFARLRRVWETTKRFWEETQVAFPDTVGPAGPRLQVVPQNRAHLDLGHFHTYELLLGRIRLSVVWDSDNCRFITCDNLDYLAKPEQAGQPIQQAIAVGQTFSIEEPAGYGSKNKIWGKITAEHVNELPGKYTPAIPILAEPRTFMALVPADKALKVVKAIQAKYEREMSKVRNRLPLTLGVVYFGRRTPLAAAMDAGRRLLKAQVTSDRWQVTRNDERGQVDAPDYLKTSSHFEQWREVRLRSGERKLSVRVSTVMGDGTTSDVWYPYWRVENNPTGRVRQFTGPDGEQWVHVCDLQPGDQVGFTLSTFDFEYLDTTARRFEVSYDGGHRRGKDKRQRPYLLEEIEQLERVWEMLKPPESTSQVTGLAALIETKRADWKKPTGAEALASPDDDPFRQLCHDALANTAWRGKKWKDLTEEDKRFLERAALSGMLADALELHLTIAKEGNGTQEAV